MKRGGRVRLSVKKLSGAELEFLLPLEGFGRAFDGPGATPEDIGAEQRKPLQDELLEKAAAERSKLEASSAVKPPATLPAEPAGR
jgi:hypothetical protein